MNVYLVGGAVRDTLLGLPIKDKDFVVVGATVAQMLAQGFVQVGADFPVFLHPHTQQEYALARTERKTGSGYLGFSVHADTDVTLEEDLLRRDLTINAMAIEVKSLFDSTPTGTVTDPYNGQQDLHAKILRHVSPAFSEDPLRVLRTARFYARYYELGFAIATDTKQLMQSIANQGELSHLSRERLWTESLKALGEKNGFAYFAVLDELGILQKILPDLSTVWQDTNGKQRTLVALQSAKNANLNIKFALLLSAFLDKPNKLDLLNNTKNALLVPKNYVNFARLFLIHSDDLMDLANICAHQLLTLLENTKAQKQDLTIFELLEAVGYINMNKANATVSFIQNAIILYNSIAIKDVDSSLTGKAIGDELTRLRLLKLETLLPSIHQ